MISLTYAINEWGFIGQESSMGPEVLGGKSATSFKFESRRAYLSAGRAMCETRG